MSKSDQFYDLLKREREDSKVNCVSMDKVKYELLINKVKSLRLVSHKHGNDYRFMKRYDVIDVNGTTKLISPQTVQESIKYFVYDEDLFQVLNDAHITTGHGGRDRMVRHLKSKYKNITYKDILIFLSLCDTCSDRSIVRAEGCVCNVNRSRFMGRVDAGQTTVENSPRDQSKTLTREIRNLDEIKLGTDRRLEFQKKERYQLDGTIDSLHRLQSFYKRNSSSGNENIYHQV